MFRGGGDADLNDEERRMTRSMTKLGRATRAGAFAAMLAIIGVTAVMASVKTARAWDAQAGEAAADDEINRQAAGRGDAVAAQPGSYASARRERRIETPPETRKSFQDLK
jgi:hypothetical protein